MVTIKLEQLRQAELAVGIGENHFSMSRGSFDYKQKVSGKTRLKKISVEEKEGCTLLTFEHPKTRELHRLEISVEEGGRIRLAYIEDSERDTAYNRFWISFPANPKEHIYGCGETYSKFDLKGEKVRIFVAEHQNARRITNKIVREKFLGKHPGRTLPFGKYESYYAQPTYVSSDRFYLHADIDAFAIFDFSKGDVTTIYTQEPPVLFTESADSFEELSGKLASLLGHQGTLPDWVYDGAILAVQEGTERIDEKIARCEKAGTKICGIWSQDWCGCRKTGFGYQVMWNWAWDKDLYHNLYLKITEWKEKGIRFLGYINPFIAIEKELYKEASEKGYCVKDKEGKDYLVTITTFPAAMVDFTNPEAYNWYKNLIKENMIGLGMGGWMADFGEYLPVDCVLFSGEDPEKIHNRWPAIWARMNKEAIAECGKEDEVFFFTRAGHTGTISASTLMWTGDQHVDWSVDDGLPSVIPATLSLAMSGYGVTHSDVGGYTTIMHMRRSKELLMRWEEMNIFSPLFRSHEGNQPVNNVQFDDDEELIRHISWASRMHAALKPYLKRLILDNANRSLPVMRPLFYHYDESRAYTETTEYLLGKDILVAPVLQEKAVSREVYLPNDKWVHLFTGLEYKGGIFKIEAPLGCPPVFIRRSSEYFEELSELSKIKL
ncbi:alpha-glucosidase [Butyrivibrio sp. FCS014]|uniref:alpha-glucosidase n=1 Tax=Butyrivibrio sp. FCS014 TaxID=1408304 RepID=UPI000462F908|nr:alpha-glucosidase [Butyrivibrio sp. FCS014]